MSQGRFIVLEGGEGVGKSTQVYVVADWLKARGREVVTTREPGGTTLSERIRDVLVDKAHTGMTPECETLLVFAARSQHVRERIQPALGVGHDVVCDRFVDASYAYQGGGRGVDLSYIRTLEQWVCGATEPDLVLLLDLDPSIGRARAARRGAADRFEQEALRFAEQVRAIYLARAQERPEHYAVIDASADAATVSASIRAALESRLA